MTMLLPNRPDSQALEQLWENPEWNGTDVSSADGCPYACVNFRAPT